MQWSEYECRAPFIVVLAQYSRVTMGVYCKYGDREDPGKVPRPHGTNASQLYMEYSWRVETDAIHHPAPAPGSITRAH